MIPSGCFLPLLHQHHLRLCDTSKSLNSAISYFSNVASPCPVSTIVFIQLRFECHSLVHSIGAPILPLYYVWPTSNQMLTKPEAPLNEFMLLIEYCASPPWSTSTTCISPSSAHTGHVNTSNIP